MPPLAMSSSCVPSSTTCAPLSSPSVSSTTMRSAERTVDRRCAMTSVVRRAALSASSSLRLACTSFSDSLSSALVASSSSRILGSLMMARAMATRCFCPPLSLPPPAPTCES
mmetsp:Transcript_12473/g.52459  ORF Transcript_12473/g.52459 Transcript_12473/m.52459 type:complete len:112 (-) Transcript_12473:535-870(-)